MVDALRTLGQYNLSEAAFEPIPDDHPLIRRHRNVERFGSPRRPPMRPRFEKSVKDELHPFPQRAMTNTNACYNGVDVVVNHFPAMVKNSAFLRYPTVKTRPVWSGNIAKAKHSNRYSYQCPALDEQEPPLSYLAQTIVEDCSQEKKMLERGWCGNLEMKSVFAAPPEEPHYTEVNKRINRRYLKTYTGPVEIARRTNEFLRETKRLQRAADEERPMTFHYRPDAPKVFKMSNVDEWWTLDPVQVCSEHLEKKDVLSTNPFRKNLSM
eukprot:gene7323-5159_t